MRMKSTFGLLCAVVAGVPSQLMAKGITYNCDTAANHYSELTMPAGSDTFTVSGEIQLRALAGSKDFAPIARVQIAAATAPGDAPTDYAGFTLGALPANAKKTPSGLPAVQMISFDVSGKKDEIVPLSMMEKPGETKHFDLRYASGSLTVAIDKEIKEFKLSVKDPVVRIVCSTGEFLITNLTVDPGS